MKASLIAAALLAVTPAAFASAEACRDVAPEKRIRPEEVQVRLEAQGYDVRRVKRDGGCYEVAARRDGKRIELRVDAADGAVLAQKDKVQVVKGDR